MGYYWFTFSEAVQESRFIREKRLRFLALIPMIFLTGLTLISFKTGWLYYIDEQNVYHRGPAYVLQLISAYGYVIFTAGKACYLSMHAKYYRKKCEYRTLAIYVLPTLLAGSLQVLFPGYPLLCVGNTFSLLYVYLTLQEQLISLDALTQLNNRNQLLQYLSTRLTHPNDRKILYLMMMDIDSFKMINDQYGHLEGDNALKIVADCLSKVCSERNYFLSRYGGDEFIVICEMEPKDSIELVCNNIHTALKDTGTPYSLTISIGYARYTENIKNQQELILLADQALYQVKQKKKQN